MCRKIVIAGNTSWYIYNFRNNLMNDLAGAGYKIEIIAPKDSYTNRFNFPHYDISMNNKGKNPIRDLFLLFQLIGLCKKLKPLVLLTFTTKIAIYGSIAARLCGIPYISNIAGIGTIFTKRNWLSRLVISLFRVAQKKAFRVFFQNDDDLALFVRKKIVVTGQYRLLPGSGVDLERFQPVEKQRSEKIKLLLSARLIWEKGIEEYVAAARIVRREFSVVEFQLLGFLNLEDPSSVTGEDIRRWTDEGVITYLGETDDVLPYLKEADCVILPSYYGEGVPRSLLEAAAMGKPIITSDSVGCRNVVDHDKNGFLCRPRDHLDLADKIKAFLSLPEERIKDMQRYSRKKAEEQFDEKIVLIEYRTAVDDIDT
jgi:glycosyltransferase involved in cell wall biosynthesis